ncbi:unnamed protein product [marine sediment metagenome]|uniref:GLUG domain-containing protein n=1 Tax=marine sediment metagenome TaxID=412755 RepID=X1RWS4_9ZZZZ
MNGDTAVGGLVGAGSGGIDNCYAEVEVQGVNQVGGLVDDNTSIVHNCFSTGDVGGDSDVGGLIGRSDSGNISNCYSHCNALTN